MVQQANDLKARILVLGQDNFLKQIHRLLLFMYAINIQYNEITKFGIHSFTQMVKDGGVTPV